MWTWKCLGQVRVKEADTENIETGDCWTNEMEKATEWGWQGIGQKGERYLTHRL